VWHGEKKATGAKADALFTDFPDVTANWLKKADTP
jgi:hypothetical protein